MVPVLTSSLLAGAPGVRHAFFTRKGGVSKGLYASLNLGVGSKDSRTAVEENRARAAMVFGVELKQLLTCYQVHSSIVMTATKPWAERPEADGVVTKAPGLVCGALTADCAPILIADAEARVVAAAHAGWRGALTGVAEAAIARMEALGARRERMAAAIGPCIGPASYEVGMEFATRFTDADRANQRFFAAGAAPDKRQFDLPNYVLARLQATGVRRAEWIGRDTCAEPDLFFSNRRAFKLGEPDYGRLLSAIVLT